MAFVRLMRADVHSAWRAVRRTVDAARTATVPAAAVVVSYVTLATVVAAGVRRDACSCAGISRNAPASFRPVAGNGASAALDRRGQRAVPRQTLARREGAAPLRVQCGGAS